MRIIVTNCVLKIEGREYNPDPNPIDVQIDEGRAKLLADRGMIEICEENTTQIASSPEVMTSKVAHIPEVPIQEKPAAEIIPDANLPDIDRMVLEAIGKVDPNKPQLWTQGKPKMSALRRALGNNDLDFNAADRDRLWELHEKMQ